MDMQAYSLHINNQIYYVHQFEISQYGINCPFRLRVKFLMPTGEIGTSVALNSAAGLQFHAPYSVRRFTGIITQYRIDYKVIPPRGLSLIDAVIELPMWKALQCFAKRTFHHQSLKETLLNLAQDVGWRDSDFSILSVPQIIKPLRCIDNGTYESFFLSTLAENRCYVVTSFDDDQVKLLISNQWADLINQDSVRTWYEVVQTNFVEDNSLRSDIYFSPNYHYRHKLAPWLELTCPHANVLPGEVIKLENQYCYRVSALTIKGYQSIRFDSSQVVLDGIGHITSKVILQSVDSFCLTQNESAPTLKTSMFTGRIETSNKKSHYAERTNRGGYQARFDFEEQAESRQADYPAYKPADSAKALRNIRFNSLMPGCGYGDDFPIHQDTEVLLTQQRDNDEVALILGCLNNRQSQAMSTGEKQYQNTLRTWSGNQFKITDGPYQQTLKLATYQMQNYLNMDYQTGEIQLKTEQGQMKMTVGQSMKIKGNNQIHIQADKSNTAIVEKDISLLSNKQNIEFKIAKQHTVKAKKDFAIVSDESLIYSRKSIDWYAQSSVELKTKSLNLHAQNKDIYLQAPKIIINAQKLLLQTKKSGLVMNSKAMEVYSEQATLDIKMAASQHAKKTLGGEVKPFKHQSIKTDPISKPMDAQGIDEINLAGSAKQPPDSVEDQVTTIKLPNYKNSDFFINLDDFDYTILEAFEDSTSTSVPVSLKKKDQSSNMPPVIVNLRPSPSDQYSRNLLTDDELAYFKKRGNNVMIFIHGYNVHYGEFSKVIEEVKVTEEVSRVVLPNALTPVEHKKKYLMAVKSNNVSTKWVDREKLIAGKHYDEDDLGNINGTETHEWVTHFEYHLNRAAGIDIESEDYQRCVFIAWPGDPENQADYILAADTSRQYGAKFANLLKQIRDYDADMQINIIAHSQGNGVMIKALDYLGEHHPKVQVDHCFFWQAAIPNYSFSTDPKYNDSPWYSPHAYKAVKHISVFHSENDNIVGPMILPGEQPEGVDYHKVFGRKPDPEMLFGFITRFTGLKSLFQAGMWLQVPFSMVLDEKQIDAAWQMFLTKHPNLQAKHPQLFKDTLAQQTKSVASDALYKFTHALGTRLRAAKPQLEAMKDYMQQRPVLLGLTLQTIYKLLSHIDHLEEALLAPFLSPPKKISKLQALLTTDMDSTMFNYMVKGMVHEKIHQYLPHFNKLMVFLYSVLILAENTVEPAMGYKGVDDETIDADKENKIEPVDTTKWVYHHSDMKYSSPDIDKELYHDRIIELKGLRFGFHTGQGV